MQNNSLPVLISKNSIWIEIEWHMLIYPSDFRSLDNCCSSIGWRVATFLFKSEDRRQNGQKRQAKNWKIRTVFLLSTSYYDQLFTTRLDNIICKQDDDGFVMHGYLKAVKSYTFFMNLFRTAPFLFFVLVLLCFLNLLLHWSLFFSYIHKYSRR
jgi:hypothetical protein